MPSSIIDCPFTRSANTSRPAPPSRKLSILTESSMFSWASSGAPAATLPSSGTSTSPESFFTPSPSSIRARLVGTSERLCCSPRFR